MDFRDSPDEAAFRERLRGWLAEQKGRFPTSGDAYWAKAGEWHQALYAAGFFGTSWPAGYGGQDLPPVYDVIVDEEIAKAGAPARPSLGYLVVGLSHHGNEELRQRFLPGMINGTERWCQGFSEPGAGSDLASLTTTAVRDGGDYLITGHKIWTSSAHTADYGALLARTDPDAAKHRGLGYFIVDMRAEGIELQPIRQANGEAHFNEVFLDDVFVPDEMLLGGPTDGWGLAIATMAQERVAISGYVNADRAGILRRLANEGGPDQHRVLSALGEADAYANAIKVLAVREVIRLLDGQPAGPASSIAKVAMNVMLRRTFKATLELTAPAALTERAAADDSPSVVEPYFHLPAELIGGGTKEIQLNIIAQMILGLPRR